MVATAPAKTLVEIPPNPFADAPPMAERGKAVPVKEEKNEHP